MGRSLVPSAPTSKVKVKVDDYNYDYHDDYYYYYYYDYVDDDYYPKDPCTPGRGTWLVGGYVMTCRLALVGSRRLS